MIGEIASALDYAASHGLVHRDVKPANILVDQLGRAHLTDFGIARTADDQTDLTAIGTTIGTVAYASPEQLQGLTVDPRSDQYSLAATAFALLTGTIVYPGSNAMAVSIAHARQEIPSASTRRPGIQVAVDQVLAHALAKDPAQRFPSSSAFAQALSAALTGAPAPVFVPQPGRQGVGPVADPNAPTQHAPTQHAPTQRPVVPGDPVAASRKPFWRRLPVVAAALVLVAALAAGTFFLWPKGEEPSADINAFDPKSAPKLAVEVANLEPVLVTPNLPSLENKPAQAVWSYSPDPDTRWQVIGGTEKYALAEARGQDVVRLAVLDAETGREVRTMSMAGETMMEQLNCRQFTGKQTLFCPLLEEPITGNDEDYGNDKYYYAAVDLEKGSVALTPSVARGIFAVTGDRAVVSSETETAVFDSTGREVWRAAGGVDDYPVSGSPVVAVSDATGFTLRALVDGSVVYRAAKDPDDVKWSPYLGGFAVQEGDGVDFYDEAGEKLSRLRGWEALEFNGYMADVTSLPIVTISRQAVGAVDPASGTLLWQQPAPAWNVASGFGTIAVFSWTDYSRGSVSATYWLDCYTGLGGRLPTGYDGNALGTDGTRLVVETSPQNAQTLAVGDPSGAVVWEVPKEQASEIYWTFGDKLYFGPRRVL